MPYHPNTQNQSGKQSYTPKPERQTNPKGFNEKPLKCKICESILHLMRNCPHKNHPNGENIILYTGTSKTEACLLTREARNSAVLDSGCTSTVAGKLWIDCYLQSLSNDKLSRVVREKSNKIFKFGNGETKQFIETITIPCVLAGKYIFIKTDVVDSDIPLLLSKDAMKQVQIKLDLISDTAEVFGTTIMLNSTTSGHYYCLPFKETIIDIDECYFNIDNNDVNKYKVLKKIHSQFAHPTKVKLKKLMEDANIWGDEYNTIADQIYESCEICKKIKRSPPRPAVALPLASEFNDAAAIDLKHWKGNLYILYMIDMFSRFTLACIIRDKHPDTVIRSFLQTMGESLQILNLLICAET